MRLEVDDDYEEEDDAADVGNVMTSDSKMRVMASKCPTCIFRPGNRMELRSGRVKEMVESCHSQDTNVICHQTIGTDAGALCAGSVDERPGQLFRIFERFNGIVFVGPHTGGTP